jgi:lipid II:glycine glycyltransferase (peptidoglycan interpeptide bridge formation enzyme)
VTDDLCREIDKIAPNFVNFSTVPNFLDVRFFTWKKFTERLLLTYVINLEKSIDEIWASFSKKCRNGIRKLSAYSPEIQQTNDVSALLPIYRERLGELGVNVPLYSDDYLKELVAAFPQDVTVYSLSIDGSIATAIVCCVMQKERYHTWIGGMNARKDNLHVDDYLTWELVKRAKSEGFKKLELGQADLRLYRNKSKFNPVLEPFYYVKKSDTLGKIGDFASKKLREAGLGLRYTRS